MAFLFMEKRRCAGNAFNFLRSGLFPSAGAFGFFGGQDEERKYGLINHCTYGMNLKIC
jgi:hypothetical protein